jgi:ATP-dependent DNA helicase PIF1
MKKKSEDYHQIFNTILTSNLDAEVPSRVVYQKLLSSLIVERDWSAQECCHLLLGCPLHKTSRHFRSLNLSWPRFNAFEPLHPTMDDEDLAPTKMSWIDHYERRNLEVNPELANISLLQIFRRYDFKNQKFVPRPRAKPRVVIVWPGYIPDKSDPAMYDNWCRAKLQLHHPYTDDVETLQQVDGEDIGWSAAYANCLLTCGDHDDDPLADEEDLDDEEEEDEFEEPEVEEIPREIRDWHQLANQGPRIRSTQHSRLGKRDLDRDFDWHLNYTTFEDLRHRESYLESQKRLIDNVDEVPDVDIANLVDNQRRIFLRVVNHYHMTLAGENPPPLRINIDGTAGTGKSYLIDAISKALTEMALERGKRSPIMRVAPTGIAAFNIHGSTLHSALSLPVRGNVKLNAQQLLILQGRLASIKYIILDEKSMVGRKLFSKIDSRLREGFNRQDGYFGGCSLLMFGDFGQLPPVADTPLFDLRPRDGTSDHVLELNKGRDAYLSLTENITLNRIMRQRGEDENARRFRKMLEHFRNNEVSDEDVELLNRRVLQDLPPQERAIFHDALCLCPTNALVDEINYNRLGASNKPVLIVPAVHTGVGASKESEETAEGLEPKILLMEGAKVMVTRNLWTGQGLTNGTMGVIGTDLLYISDIHR